MATIEEAIVIKGGGLKPSSPWVPTITEIDGKNYVALAKTDRRFCEYAGLEEDPKAKKDEPTHILFKCDYLKVLKKQRQTLCERLGRVKQSQRDGNDTGLDSFVSPAKKPRLDPSVADLCPSTVTLALPEIRPRRRPCRQPPRRLKTRALRAP